MGGDGEGVKNNGQCTSVRNLTCPYTALHVKCLCVVPLSELRSRDLASPP